MPRWCRRETQPVVLAGRREDTGAKSDHPGTTRTTSYDVNVPFMQLERHGWASTPYKRARRACGRPGRAEGVRAAGVRAESLQAEGVRRRAGRHRRDQQDRGPGPPQTQAAIRSRTGTAHGDQALAAVAVPVVR